MRLAVLAAILFVALLAGCAGKETAADCSSGEAYNPHEGRCVAGTEGRSEVCHAWIRGGADEESTKVSCQVWSDGSAWLDSTVNASHAFRIEVRDAAGVLVYGKDVQFGGSAPLTGAKGTWTLTVDFRDVAATGEVVLWG